MQQAMRAGTEVALARVVRVFSAASPRHACLLADRHADRMKGFVHDGIGLLDKHAGGAPT